MHELRGKNGEWARSGGSGGPDYSSVSKRLQMLGGEPGAWPIFSQIMGDADRALQDGKPLDAKKHLRTAIKLITEKPSASGMGSPETLKSMIDEITRESRKDTTPKPEKFSTDADLRNQILKEAKGAEDMGNDDIGERLRWAARVLEASDPNTNYRGKAAHFIGLAADLAHDKRDLNQEKRLRSLIHRVNMMQGDVVQKGTDQEYALKWADKAAKIVPGLLSGRAPGLLGGREHSAWNGQLGVFAASGNPYLEADLDWDGRMRVSDVIAAQVREDMESDGEVKHPEALMIQLHELIHGTLPGSTDRTVPGVTQRQSDALLAFDHMDSFTYRDGPEGSYHSLAELQAEHGLSDASDITLASLSDSGYLEHREQRTEKNYAGVITVKPEEWRLSAKGVSAIPKAPESYKAHMSAYQDPTNAAIEEGNTELGAIFHAPEFFDAMGVGGRPTPITAVDENGAPVDNPEALAKLGEIKKAIGDIQRRLADSSLPHGQAQALEIARSLGDVRMYIAVYHDDVNALSHLSKLQHSGWPEFSGDADRLRKMIGEWKALGSQKHATLSEYAERLQNPDRIMNGDAWGHYPQQTAAAYQWARLVADARGNGPEGIRAVSDEINRQGPAGKRWAMATQVAMLATGNDVPDPSITKAALREIGPNPKIGGDAVVQMSDAYDRALQAAQAYALAIQRHPEAARP
jgi:hypothetical protein